MSAEDILKNRCQEFGKDVERLNAAIFTRMGYTVPRNFHALAQTAVFLAYIDLGGDPATADAFPWDARKRQVVDRASYNLRADLRDRGSSYYEQQRMVTNRRTRHIDRRAWDLWDRFATDGTAYDDHEKPNPSWDDTVQERDLHDGMLSRLRGVARALLNSADWCLIEQVYFNGVSQRDLTLAFMAQHPDRYGPDDFDNAYVAVRMQLMRARQRLKERLPSEWAALAQEID